MASTGVIPTYQRFVNGAPVPSVSRRSFRPREKYLILLVFLTFGVVCFGAFFFLPEYKGGTNAVNNVYVKWYEQLQNAPQILLPPPPHSNDVHNEIGLVRHGDSVVLDPHKLEDKVKLLAKIEQDELSQKVLERPNVIPSILNSLSSKSVISKTALPLKVDEQAGNQERSYTPSPGSGERYSIANGEDKDPVARERRNKVKQVGISIQTELQLT